MWEDRGGFALLWLIAAVLAPLLRAGQVRYQAGLCLGLFVFGAGGTLLGRLLPGFNLFRQHPRVLVVVSFGVAYLAGVTTEALFSEAGLPAALWRLCWYTALTLGVLAFLLSAGFTIGLILFDDEVNSRLLAGGCLTFSPGAGTDRPRGRPGAAAAVGWSILLLVDLWR